MKLQSVSAVVRVGDREVSAEFRLSTGRLLVSEGAEPIEDLRPPDSWMALAFVNLNGGWGTRPTPTDLLTFLERYVAAHPRLRVGPTS